MNSEQNQSELSLLQMWKEFKLKVSWQSYIDINVL